MFHCNGYVDVHQGWSRGEVSSCCSMSSNIAGDFTNARQLPGKDHDDIDPLSTFIFPSSSRSRFYTREKITRDMSLAKKQRELILLGLATAAFAVSFIVTMFFFNTIEEIGNAIFFVVMIPIDGFAIVGILATTGHHGWLPAIPGQ